MINNSVSNQPNFKSSYIPKNAKVSINNITNSLDKYFELKGFAKSSPAKIREKISLDQVGLGLTDNGMVVVGKDREADAFAARMLKKNNIPSEYKQDTPETKFEGPILDLTI